MGKHVDREEFGVRFLFPSLPTEVSISVKYESQLRRVRLTLRNDTKWVLEVRRQFPVGIVLGTMTKASHHFIAQVSQDSLPTRLICSGA